MQKGTPTEPNGLWLIDKPIGISSFGVIARLRRRLEIRKIGHAGTLDPLASGLLLVLVGKEFTRQADGFLKLDKVYEFEITLGATSTTDDAEGELTLVSDEQPTRDSLDSAIKQLHGEILQIPPQFSAIKVAGRRAYTAARAGQPVALVARPVQVYAWSEIEYDYPYLRGSVHVGSGTYIRSLARDLGQALGTGGYLSNLRRTRVGEYRVEDALQLD